MLGTQGEGAARELALFQGSVLLALKVRPPGSRAARCPGGHGNEVSLGSPGVSQMVIKCDEGFDQGDREAPSFSGEMRVQSTSL